MNNIIRLASNYEKRFQYINRNINRNINRKNCKNKHIYKTKPLYEYNNKNIYIFNYNSYLRKFAIIIQSFYKGYKQRKLIKNIYKKLPDDIQYKIIHNIRQDYYYKKTFKTIETILINKLKKFSCNIFAEYDEDQFIHFKYFEYVNNNREYIIYIYKLYLKYSLILSNNFIKNSYHLTDNLILMNFKIDDYKYSIFNAYTNNIYEVTCATYSILEKLWFDGGFITEF